MNPFNVLKRPILSEKSTDARENHGRYTFEIDLNATKTDVANAVKAVFGVSPVNVATVNTRGKVRRRGKHVSVPKLRRKAVVKLAKGQKIKLFEDQ